MMDRLRPTATGIALTAATAMLAISVTVSIAETRAAHAMSILPALSLRPTTTRAQGPPYALPRKPGTATATPTPTPKAKARPRSTAGQLNINTATVAELDRLPGVGEKKAKRIVLWRTRHGPFKRIADLRRVRGFGRRSVTRLAPLIRVSGPNTLQSK